MRARFGVGLVLGVALLGGCSPGVTTVGGMAAPVTGGGPTGPAVSGIGEPVKAPVVAPRTSAPPTSRTAGKSPSPRPVSGTAAARLPGVVVDYGTVEQVVQVRPARIRPFKDVNYSEITWTRLTATTGEAEGLRNENQCNPCAAGVYLSTPVRLKFSQVQKTAASKLVFTRVRVTVRSTGEVFTHDLPLTTER